MAQNSNEHLPNSITGLITGAGAVAAIMSRAQGQQVIYGGDFSERACHKMLSALEKYWPVSPYKLYNRWMGLSLDGKFYWLSAQYMGKSDDLLGLVFSFSTSLSQIRLALDEVTKSLDKHLQSKKVLSGLLEQSLQLLLKPYPKPDPERLRSFAESGWQIEVEKTISVDEEKSVPGQRSNPLVNKENNSASEVKNYLSYGGLSPEQRHENLPLDDGKKVDLMIEEIPWHPVEVSWETASNENRVPLAPPHHPQKELKAEGENSDKQDKSWQPLQTPPPQENDLASILQEDFDLRDDLDAWGEWMLAANEAETAADDTSLAEASANWVEDPPLDSPDKAGNNDEDLVAVMSFYLVPRVDDQLILGELPDLLHQWIPAICKKYGWQLDFLFVHPGYVRVTLGDFPELLIHAALQIIRQETNKQIFYQFPNLKQHIQGGDFWAPGYLVDTQNRAFSTQDILLKVAESQEKP